MISPVFAVPVVLAVPARCQADAEELVKKVCHNDRVSLVGSDGDTVPNVVGIDGAIAVVQLSVHYDFLTGNYVYEQRN